MAEASFRRILAFLDEAIALRLGVRRREAGLLVALALLAVALLAPAALVLQPAFGYAALAYLLASVGIAAGALARALWLLRRGPGREAMALEVEAACPELRNNLISSLQLFPRRGALGADDPTSPALVGALVEETRAQVERLEPARFVSTEGPRRLGRLAALMGAAALAVGLLWPGVYPGGAFLLAHAVDLMPSRRIALFLTAQSRRVLRGVPVSFEVRTEGPAPGRVELEIAPLAPGAAPAPPGRLPMERAGERRFRATWAGGAAGVRVRARSGRFRSAPVEVAVVEAPRVERVGVVIFPPEYTGLKPKRGGAGGGIRAYLGSSVMVRARVSKPVREAVLALADGWRIPMKESGEGGVFEGMLLLGGPGSYQVRLKDAFGFANFAPPRYRIDIVPDTPPRIAVVSPAEDVTVEADEEVAIRYEGGDDFGIRNVYLEVRHGNRPAQRIRVWGGEETRKEVRGAYLFDLRAMGMRPGGWFTYRVLAEDTDTVSGPKVSSSRVYRVKVRDREAVMTALDKDLGKISGRLLDLLGDYLERDAPAPEAAGARKARGAGPRPPRAGDIAAMRKKAEAILGEIRKARARLRPQNRREALAHMDLGNLGRQLEDALERYFRPAGRPGERAGEKRTRRDGGEGGERASRRRREREEGLAARREEATESLERMATLGEEIQRNLRLGRAGRTADALLRRQRALERALERLRREGGAGPEARRRIERELAKLEKELGELMRQMASLARRMPAEFMNQRGMREMPVRSMMRAFERIRRQMRRGDIRGALESLRRLMAQMQRMRAALRGIRRRQMMAQRGGGPIRRRQSELAAIVEEQQAILGETVSVLDNVVDRMKKGWPRGLRSVSAAVARALKEERAREAWAREAGCRPKEPEPEEAEAPRPPPGAGPPTARRPLASERREAMEEIASLAKRGEWASLHQRLPEWERALARPLCEADARAKASAKRWRGAGRRLESLLKKAERRAPGGDVSKMQGLRFRQGALRRRLADFEERLRRLMQVYPFVDPNILRRIVEAGGFMGRAASSLNRRSPSRAVPAEEEAIRRLAQGQNAMQQAMRQMAQRGRAGMGTPRGFGIYRQGPGANWWARNPNFPNQQGLRPPGRNSEEGNLGTQFSEVLIPGREQYKVPPKFREEIMEALKDGLPDSLRGEIEDYFDRLTK